MGQDATEVIEKDSKYYPITQYTVEFRIIHVHEVIMTYDSSYEARKKALRLIVDGQELGAYSYYSSVQERFILDGTECEFHHHYHTDEIKRPGIPGYQSEIRYWNPGIDELWNLSVNKKVIWRHENYRKANDKRDFTPSDKPPVLTGGMLLKKNKETKPQVPRFTTLSSGQSSGVAAPPQPVPPQATPPKKEQKPYPVPKNRYDLIRWDQLYGGAASLFIAELFLLAGVGGLVGVWTQSWILALLAVGTALVASYLLGYRKVFSPFTLGIIAVLSGAVVVASTSSLSTVAYDHTYLTQLLFGVQRMLTIRHQIIAGAVVGAIASLWGLGVFNAKRTNDDGMGVGILVGIFYGLGGGGILWLVVLVLGSIFNWGFGLGNGWFNSLLDGYLVTAIAGEGLIFLLYVWRKTKKPWGWRDAARWRLEERFGDKLDAGLLEALSQADETKIKELLPQIATGTPDELLAKVRSQGI